MLTGKGFFTWKIPDCEGGNPAAIAETAKAAGLTHLLIKICDGFVAMGFDKNGKDLVPALVDALEERSIMPVGWGYAYGLYPEAEANMAIKRATAMRVQAFVVDAEVEYKQEGRSSAAKLYMDRLRAGLQIPIGLSSYRFPSLHREFPWSVFLKRCDFALPQVYWMQAHNAGAQLLKSASEYKNLAPELPYIPTGAACREHGWQPTVSEIIDFLDTAKRIGVQAVNFWEWSDARKPDLLPLWNTIAEYAWPGTPPSPPPPPPPPLEGLVMRVVQDGLNVRTGPGLNFTPIGKLAEGQQVRALDVGGAGAWVEIEFNGQRAWANVQIGTDRNMEPVG